VVLCCGVLSTGGIWDNNDDDDDDNDDNDAGGGSGGGIDGGRLLNGTVRILQPMCGVVCVQVE
jgi:hypothetical protein